MCSWTWVRQNAVYMSREKFVSPCSAKEGLLATAQAGTGPMMVRAPHFAPRAKACICLYMEGAPSQMDLFDPKPKLQELATFTQQLANLLKCGMPLTVALESMSHLETKGIPSGVSKELKQEVMEGRSLSDAM